MREATPANRLIASMTHRTSRRREPQSPFDYDAPCDPPYAFVPVTSTSTRRIAEEFRDRIGVHTVHDGSAIPSHFRVDSRGRPRVDPEELDQRFIEERDWGANLVAERIAEALGIAGYGSVRVARVLLDCNRFPGSTPPTNRDALSRMAIIPPFAGALSHEHKSEILELYYDRIIDAIEARLAGKLISIFVHTYNEHNPSLTRRPDCSLITLPRHYWQEARMPYGVFDPMYPDRLAESTCSRVLRDRISLNLERTGLRVIHNHPYPATEGSLEMRSQVWYFFQFVKEEFQRQFPRTTEQESFKQVWLMLLNTNQRLQETEALRGYLHQFRRVPSARLESFAAARSAYEQIQKFVDDSDVVRMYRRSPGRPSSLALEVRKDLVCNVDAKTGRPTRLGPEQEDAASVVGRAVADAIVNYFEADRGQS